MRSSPSCLTRFEPPETDADARGTQAGSSGCTFGPDGVDSPFAGGTAVPLVRGWSSRRCGPTSRVMTFAIDWNVTARTGAPHIKEFREREALPASGSGRVGLR